MPNHSPVLFQLVNSAQDSDLTLFFQDLSQSLKHSEIERPSVQSKYIYQSNPGSKGSVW